MVVTSGIKAASVAVERRLIVRGKRRLEEGKKRKRKEEIEGEEGHAV